ncbi:hypothetical protein DFQ28_011692 [Apophysomyces sp. BC1034]|nr:hypothetical protein DFQ30_011267 [Apophysomyces sp. BC1015]KAG0177807.1 hypothetical protein DFQ29_004318 [Apophysomyces sp. BC1021]KAG0191507.1 hypothetical protein DFQ28_011692 [Apophysomyces sp. BC1034]
MRVALATAFAVFFAQSVLAAPEGLYPAQMSSIRSAASSASVASASAVPHNMAKRDIMDYVRNIVNPRVVYESASAVSAAAMSSASAPAANNLERRDIVGFFKNLVQPQSASASASVAVASASNAPMEKRSLRQAMADLANPHHKKKPHTAQSSASAAMSSAVAPQPTDMAPVEEEDMQPVYVTKLVQHVEHVYVEVPESADAPAIEKHAAVY